MDLYKNHKPNAIRSWKYRGLIHNDIDMLYEEYINTFNCNHCAKEFKTTKDRCLDHCHTTGVFRKIVCHACNTNDNYINYPDGVPSLKERDKKYGKKYREKNKEKEIEKHNCECGGKFTKRNKARHMKTKKHLDSLEN